MVICLLCVALFALPLIGPAQISPFVDIKELWKSKEFFTLIAILAICIIPYANQEIKPNWWLKALLIFVIISTFLIPPVVLQLGSLDLSGIWCWRAMAWILAYFLLYRKIASLHIFGDEKTLIAKVIGYAAFISAIYAIVQFLNIDQFQVLRGYKEIGNKTAGDITAMIGSPIFLAVWLGICFPFCVIYMRWWQTVVVCLAILACQSDTATAGMVLTLVFMGAMRCRSTVWLKGFLAAAVIGIAVLVAFWPQIRPKIGDNGRFLVWKQTIEDWRAPAIVIPVTPDMTESKKMEIEALNKRTWTLTGRGPGSFEFFFTRKHEEVAQYGRPIVWNDPHNIYLRILYEIGLIGLGLFLAAIGSVLWGKFVTARGDYWTCALFCSFCFILFAGMTTPILTIEPLRLYCVAVFSLLSISRATG